MIRIILLLSLLITVLALPAQAAIYMAPASAGGSDANSGTIASPYLTLTKALSVSGPDSVIYVRGGIYSYSSTITLSSNGTAGHYINIWAYPGESPVFDFSGESYSSSMRGIQISGNYLYLKGLEIKYAGDNGIFISGGHNRVEQCVIHENRDSGLQISSGGHDNLIINCDSYANYDPGSHGGNADGFSPKLDVGAGNEFHGCRSWNNSDDGWDCYGSNYATIIDSCWTFRNGINIWGDSNFGGNGNGFKVGGNYTVAHHTVTHCVSFDNAQKGFDQNHNGGGVTLYNCTSWRNSTNFSFPDAIVSGRNTLRNNISYGWRSSSTSINAGLTDQSNNSWQGFTVTSGDFLSFDTTLAKAPRNADGSLPVNNFMRLAATSAMNDAGMNVGLPYYGPAPDLGAFETNTGYILTLHAVNGTVTKNPDSTAYFYGASVQLTATPAAGYQFVSWSGDVTGSANPAIVVMTASKSVTANFALTGFTITVNTANGTVTKNPVDPYYLGQQVVLTATPNSGYHFIGWSGDITGTASPETVIIAGSMNVNAQFSSNSLADFRTHQSGNWNDVNTWERNTNGGLGWVYPASAAPSSSDGVITILGGHAVTVTANVAVDQVTVNASGSLIVAASKTLTVSDAADSIDLAVYGTLNNFGTVTVNGRVSFENGGLYIHSVPGTTATAMPISTFRTGSTCRVDSSGTTSSNTAPTNLSAQTLYNLIWNASNQGVNGGPNFPDGTVINGNLTVTDSKALQFRLSTLTAGQTKNIYIRGNVYVNGANGVLTSTGSTGDAAAQLILNVDGGVFVTAGVWALNNSSASSAVWNVKGNISVTGGSFLTSGSSGTSDRRILNFMGGGTQQFSVISPGVIGNAKTTFKASNNTAVVVNFPWTLASLDSINLTAGTFVTTSTNVITMPVDGKISGGSVSNFINGPLGLTVASAGPASITFPIGKGAVYRPVTLTVNHDSATATVYTAEVFNTAPTSRTIPPGLASVASGRYYTMTKGAGASLFSPGATVQLNYDADDAVSSASLLRVAKSDTPGTAWHNIGGAGTANTTGSITSDAFTSFSDFVLATADTSYHPLVHDTIVASAGPNGSITPSGSVMVVAGTDTNFTFLPASHYHVDSVFVDGSYVGNPASYRFTNVTIAHTIRVTFAPDTYTIIVTQGTGGTITPGTTTVHYGDMLAFVVSPNAGYHLDTLLVDGVKVDSTTHYTFSQIAAGHTIRASFGINQYALTLVTANGTVIKNPDRSMYSHGDTVILTAAPSSGYHFVDWTGDLTGAKNPDTLVMTSAKTVTANFAVNVYALTLVTVGSGTLTKSPDQTTFNHGDSVLLTATPQSGWHFIGWSGGGLSGTTNPVKIVVDSAKHITAAFSLNQYALTLLADHGTVEALPAGPIFDFHTSVTLTANANTGYHFTGWSGVLSGSTNPTSVSVDSNMTIQANFAINTYSVTVTQSDHGVIAPGGTVTGNYGDTLGFSITPDHGYHLDTLVVDEVRVGSTAQYTFTHIDGNHVLRAVFAPNTYTLTVPTVGNGTVATEPAGGSFNYHTSILLTATPAPGHHFIGWSGAFTGTENPINIFMDSAVTVTASFAPNTYTLNITIDGGGAVAKAPEQDTYDYGTAVQLIASPNDRTWKFSGWSGDVTGAVDSVSLVIDASKNITAHFEQDANYLTAYRTFTMDSLAKSKDNFGKAGKSVTRKPATDSFRFRLFRPTSPPCALMLTFSAASTGCVVAGGDTIATFARLKSVTTPPVGQLVVTVSGKANSGKKIKVSFIWATPIKQTKGTVADTSYEQNQLGLAMPNRLNALYESMPGYGPDGFVVGKNYKIKGVVDSAKYYGWLQTKKADDLWKSLIVLKTGQEQTGAVHGFDNYLSAKPVFGAQKSLPPSKYNSRLLGDLIALRLSITASATQITPLGFGELKYHDVGSRYDGLTVKEIAHLGDSLMMGWYDNHLIHQFRPQAEFDALDEVIGNINGAFEGPIDTTSFGGKLVMTGTQILAGVLFLEANPGVVPAQIVPLTATEQAQENVPAIFKLYQNYPNPFNPTTTISFDLPQQAMVTVKIYNVLGQEVATLLDHELLSDGSQEITFDAHGLASGLYFYRLAAESINDDGTASTGSVVFQTVKKMLLVR